MTRSIRPLLFLAAFFAGATATHGGLRLRYEDATVAERSELIVVGRLQGESIRQVMHEERRPGEGRSWEYHATLAITEVLKGKTPGEEIPIVVHYGLSPTRQVVQYGLDENSPREEVGPIAMYDTGNSIASFSPLIDDVEAENLWFLRRRSGRFGQEAGTGDYGIVDPEDVQPLRWKEYFLAYLTSDPEGAVAEYLRKNPEASYRAKPYLAHLEVQRILKIAEPAERCDKLLPHFLDRISWSSWEAKAGLLFCGPQVGAKLKTVFMDPKHREIREEIIRLWSDMGYKEAAPFLIQLLEKHNRSRQAQRLEKKGLRNDGSEADRQDLAVIGEVIDSVWALKRFQDPRAMAALKATRDRWKTIACGDQIVEESELAIRELAQLSAGTSQEARTPG